MSLQCCILYLFNLYNYNHWQHFVHVPFWHRNNINSMNQLSVVDWWSHFTKLLIQTAAIGEPQKKARRFKVPRRQNAKYGVDGSKVGRCMYIMYVVAWCIFKSWHPIRQSQRYKSCFCCIGRFWCRSRAKSIIIVNMQHLSLYGTVRKCTT